MGTIWLAYTQITLNPSISDQLWKQLPNMTLVNKGSSWQHQEKKFELPQEGREHNIQRKDSKYVLGFRLKKNGEPGKYVKLVERDSSKVKYTTVRL